MKVALIIEQLDVSRGGRETSVAQIASGLAEAGCEVSVICQRGSCIDSRVELVQVGTSGGPRWQQLRRFVARVRRQMKAGKYDIVHATLPLPGANVYQPRGGTIRGQYAASLRRRSGVVRSAAAAGKLMNVSRMLGSLYERRMLSDRKVICLCVSEMVAEEFRELYRRRDGVKVVFNAVDVPAGYAEAARKSREDFRRQLSAGEGDLVFMSVAKNFALKGVRQTIEAFGLFASRRQGEEHRLVLIGERNSHDTYHRLVQGLGLDGRVVFIPHEDNVFARYPAADVCVLLSWYDPCSRVILEAIRCGIPSITTRFNGAAEALARGAGVVVDSPADVERVAGAMDELASANRRRQCVEACTQLSDELGIDRHVRELLEAYREVVKKK